GGRRGLRLGSLLGGLFGRFLGGLGLVGAEPSGVRGDGAAKHQKGSQGSLAKKGKCHGGQPLKPLPPLCMLSAQQTLKYIALNIAIRSLPECLPECFKFVNAKLLTQ